MNETKENKKYKSIGEVAKILNLVNKKKGSFSAHTIRFWEKEFKQIKPKVFSGKRRYYDEKTINLLLKDKGMTLNGVKKVLKYGDSYIDELHNTSIKQKDIVKSKLIKIKKILNKLKENNG